MRGGYGNRGNVWRLDRKRNRKCRSLPWHAGDSNISAHEIGEPARYGKAEPRPCCAACGFLFDLPEWIEDSVEVFGLDADSRIRHDKLHFRRERLRLECDRPCIGELRRIGEKVHENLSHL